MDWTLQERSQVGIWMDDHNALQHCNHHTTEQLSAYIETMAWRRMKLAVIKTYDADHTEHLVQVPPQCEKA